MNRIRQRAQSQFPTVLLTLISIIQALALELLWSKTLESPFLWELNMQSLIGWGMVSVSLLGIIQIWIMYSTMVMGFIWRPSLRDSVFPFVLGLQQFVMISLISDEFNGTWFYVLASIFVTANWVMQISLRRARKDPQNSEFFDATPPATVRDFAPTLVTIAVLIVFGVLVGLLPQLTWLPVLAMVLANCILAVQIYFSRRLWSGLMSLPARPEDAPEKDGEPLRAALTEER